MQQSDNDNLRRQFAEWQLRPLNVRQAIALDMYNIGLNLPRVGGKVFKKWLLCVG